MATDRQGWRLWRATCQVHPEISRIRQGTCLRFSLIRCKAGLVIPWPHSFIHTFSAVLQADNRSCHQANRLHFSRDLSFLVLFSNSALSLAHDLEGSWFPCTAALRPYLAYNIKAWLQVTKALWETLYRCWSNTIWTWGTLQEEMGSPLASGS